MKSKIALLLGCLVIGTTSVNAMTLNKNGYYENSRGAIISQDEYISLKKENKDDEIDRMSREVIDLYLDPKMNRKENTIYEITTYKLDSNGKIVDEKSMLSNEIDAKRVAQNDNLIVGDKGKLVDKNLVRNNYSLASTLNYVDDYTYATASKRVTGNYFYDSSIGKYVIQVWATWYTTPTIKQFDVIAARWNNSVSVSGLTAWQDCDSNTGITYYDLANGNVKYTNYGLGVSMNIHDSAKNRIELFMRVESSNYFGYDFYATYQHARNSNANTLAISKSYSFSSSGLGGVLYYSNSTYRNYYDGMQGIHYHYE